MNGSAPKESLRRNPSQAPPVSPTLQNSNTPPSPVTPPRIPDHELLRCIGRGSYGEVWLARNALGAYRAVKIVLRRTFEHDRPFEREFGGIQKFEPISRSHEGLVDLLQVGRNDQEGYFYYVMELADDAAENPKAEIRNPKEAASTNDLKSSGSEAIRALEFEIPSSFAIRNSELYVARTLKHDLICRGRLPFEDCVRHGLALTTALAHLHNHGLVHRDIKPSNIIFVDGVPKLADVGLVAGVDEARSYVGTEGYIPPEGPGSPQADLYSLGIMLYVMSTGKSHADFPEPLPDLSSDPDHARWLELNAVIHKACRADVRERYRNAEDMGAELALLERGKSVKHKRAVERRWTIAKKFGLAALLLLIAGLPLSKVLKHGKSENPEARRLYELGRWHYNQLTDESFKRAIEYLNQAVQIDPQFVRPYVSLFEIYCFGIAEKQKTEKLKQIATKLLSIDPKLGEGHAALSMVKYGDGDWKGAEREMRLAIQLNPKYAAAHGIYGFYLALQGRVAEAHTQLRQAQQLDPTSRIEATVAGFPFMAERQYDQAIAQFQRALVLDPNFAFAHSWVGKALEAKGDYLGAIVAFEKSDLLSGEGEANARQQSAALRQALTESGPNGYWLKALELEEAAANQQESKKLSRIDRWSLAGIYARLGGQQKALDQLEKEFAAGDQNTWLKLDACFDSLHDEPRFKVLLKQAGLEN